MPAASMRYAPRLSVTVSAVLPSSAWMRTVASGIGFPRESVTRPIRRGAAAKKTVKKNSTTKALDGHDLCGQDVRYLTELLDHIIPYKTVHEQQRQCLAALMLASQMHSGNIDIASAQNVADSSNDAGLVVVRKEDHVTVRHDLQRVAI